MKIRSVSFVSSNTSYKTCPNDLRPEIAFIGRSNVGKSSLINVLLNRKQLARVSKIPGKTQLMHHFLVNDQFYFVDLPGYGWAQVSHATKIKWGTMLRTYLLYRPNLITVFLLVDAKIMVQPIDLACIRWMAMNHIPFAIIFTKADKKYNAISQKHHMALQRILEQEWATMPPIFMVSAHDRLGIEGLLDYAQFAMGSARPNPV